jgi:hypothetical protein
MVGTQVEFLVHLPTGIVSRPPTAHRDIVARMMQGRNGICHATIMMCADAARRCGGYRLKGAGEELDFCLRMCEIGRAMNLDAAYYYYRILANSVSVERRLEMKLGYAYAIEAARCRRERSVEPDLDVFCERWRRRTAREIRRERIEDWAFLQYRLGIVDYGEGRRWTARRRMVSAALARPSWCLWHAQQLLFRGSHKAALIEGCTAKTHGELP